MSEDFGDDRINRIRRRRNEHLHAIAKNIVSDLSSECSYLSGDDSGLMNLWEEFAVQIMGEDSCFFSLYEDRVEGFCMAAAKKLSSFELHIFGYFTEAYIDWWFDRDDNNMIEPTTQELAEWVAKEMYSEVCQLAEDAVDEINARLETEKSQPEEDEGE